MTDKKRSDNPKKPLTFKVKNSVGYLTLNRPRHYNAFDLDMVEAFEDLLNQLQYDDTTRVIILDGGQAKGFCAGLDTKAYGPKIFEMPPV